MGLILSIFLMKAISVSALSHLFLNFQHFLEGQHGIQKVNAQRVAARVIEVHKLV